MKKIILMCLLTLTLAACGSSNSSDKTATCTLKDDSNENNVADVKVTKTDGKLSKIVMEVNGELVESYFDEYSAEELEDLLLEGLIGELDGYAGITSDIKVDDKEFTYSISVNIDPSKMNDEELEEMDIADLDADAFAKQLSDSGYSCGDFK